MGDRRRRLVIALGALIAIYLAGTLGFFLIGSGRWSLLDCAYMTAITLSTVGFNEVIDVSTVAGGRIFTMFLVITGVSAVLYFASNVMAFLVEGELRELLGSRRMDKKTQKLRRHYIVCGVGRTGCHTVANLVGAGHRVAMVDLNPGPVRSLLDDLGVELPYIIGDATEEKTLQQVGIERARGIICALDSDQANLYTVVTARELNPALRIVVKAEGANAAKKFRLVGADSVVAPTELGGRRLFVETVQPNAAKFLENLLLPGAMDLTVNEIVVDKTSILSDLTVAEAELRKQVGNVLLLAIQPSPDEEWEYNPGPSSQLPAGARVMAMGSPQEIGRLRRLATGNRSRTDTGTYGKPDPRSKRSGI